MQNGTRRWASKLDAANGLVLVRLTIGAMLVWVFFENLGKGLYTAGGYSGLINHYIQAGHAPGAWKAVMALAASHAATAAPMQAMTEISLGILLIIGLLTRPAAFIAFLYLGSLLLPLYWKRVRIRDAVLAAGVVGLLYVPFLNHGRIPVGSLGTYVQSFRFNDPVFAALERMAPPQLVAGLAVLVGVLVAAWLRSSSPEFSPDAFAWPMAASLLCAPVVYPWYLLWLVPFLRSVSTLPIILWTVSIIPTYVVWHLRTIGRPWLVPGWVMLLEYGSVAITAAIILLRRITRPAVPQYSTE